ncbi:DUF6207 family protein [Streptomyces sp. NPDC060011]|uniref:DUF6207 family protein n=1 Tax=unclassified Streptomyces TaxID=2593676 RepID=UPI00225B4EA9|nr:MULTISPECIES: DUF6207 family protein [unclassified Streptomyces]MCX4920243.1 DUF6207 family protein [Streptomyces sp. NBC_00687]WSD82714.1 DUF6207 family protein [Streptomyces sp. NBC_01558]
MTFIDNLLARALLLQDPQIPLDTIAYDDNDYFTADDASHPSPSVDAAPADVTAAAHLRSLCEVAVTHATADHITEFITEQLPEPRGAWILGCLLQLSDAEEGARYWWQYAAGAGDRAASYCLYLHHRAQGDRRAADLWHAQADTVTDPIDVSVPTVLRVLEHLAPGREYAYSDSTLAVMSYVSQAVTDGYSRHPNYEIPLPGPYFAEHIQIILAATSTTGDTRETGQCPTISLPARPAPECNPAADACTDALNVRRALPADADQVLVEVAAADAESASAFREAVATCWQRVTQTTRERDHDQHGVRLRYYLDRRALLQAFRGCRSHRTAQA